MNPRRLYRCRHDRQLAGVAAGMAEYFDLDPTVVRILWILSALFGGFTILLYVILAFVIPQEPAMMPGPGYQPNADGTVAEPGAGTDAEAGAPTQWTAHAGWAAPGPYDHRPVARGSGRAGFVLGVLLVVFGTIALAGALLPSLIVGASLGPAFVLALGIALLVGSARRTADER